MAWASEGGARAKRPSLRTVARICVPTLVTSVDLGVESPGSAPARSRRPIGARWIPVVGIYLALGLFAYLHAWTGGVSHTIVSCGCSDQAQEVWFLNWGAFALEHLRNPLFSTWINYPDGANLMVNTSMPVLAFLGAPVTWLFGAVTTYTLLLCLMFTTSATAAFVLAWRWTDRLPIAFLGGLVYGFCPFMVAQGSGHLFLGFTPIPPLALLVLDDILVRQRGRPWIPGVLLGFLVALQLGISAEILALMGIMSAVGLLLLVLGNLPRLRTNVPFAWRSLSIAMITFVVLAGYPLWMMLAGPQHTVGPAQGGYGLNYQVDVLGAIWPTSNQWITLGSWTARANHFTIGPGENGAYLGLPSIVLLGAITVCMRRNRAVQFFAALSVIAFVLSLGRNLRVGGRVLPVPLPFTLLAKLPLLNGAFAHRISLFVALFTMVLLVIGLDRLADWEAITRSRVASVAAVAIVAVALVPLVPELPFTSLVPTNVPSYFTSADVLAIPEGSVVLPYPYSVSTSNFAQLWQAESGMRFKMPGGYVYVPIPVSRAPEPYPYDITSATLSSLYAGVLPAETPALRTALVGQWRTRHVQTVLYVALGAHPAQAEQFLQWVLGRPPSEAVGGVIVWYNALDPG